MNIHKKARLTPRGRERLVLAILNGQIMTDNGSCYKARNFAKACKRRGIKHIRTKPYTPRTNGKAERFIKTALNERPPA